MIQKPVHRSPAVLALLLALLVPAASRAVDPAIDYRPADPQAPPVTAKTLYQNERFWPYHVTLKKDFSPPDGSKAIPAGTRAVLIRVEASGRTRLDFGRDGLYELPPAASDVVEVANRVRLGQDGKIAPNYVHVIGTRLVSSESSVIRPYRFSDVFVPPGFLALHVDPRAPGFADIAHALAPLRDRHGVMSVLFPMGRRPDPETRELLRGLDWKVPFVMFQLAEGYTTSQLPADMKLPAVVLQTREGRVIYQSTWGPGVLEALTKALDESFGGQAKVAGR